MRSQFLLAPFSIATQPRSCRPLGHSKPLSRNQTLCVRKQTKCKKKMKQSSTHRFLCNQNRSPCNTHPIPSCRNHLASRRVLFPCNTQQPTARTNLSPCNT